MQNSECNFKRATCTGVKLKVWLRSHTMQEKCNGCNLVSGQSREMVGNVV